MSIHGHEIHEQFKRHVPIDAVKGIVTAMEIGYQAAWDVCGRELCDEIRNQAWGYLRWLKIDSELMGVGQRYGKASHFELNTHNTHIGHTELHFGPFILTAIRTANQDSKPNKAAYRDCLAEANQLKLFERPAEDGSDVVKIWGAIQHVPDVKSHRPASIRVVFYDKDYALACPSIDLRAMIAAQTVVIKSVNLRPVVKIKPV